MYIVADFSGDVVVVVVTVSHGVVNPQVTFFYLFILSYRSFFLYPRSQDRSKVVFISL